MLSVLGLGHMCHPEDCPALGNELYRVLQQAHKLTLFAAAWCELVHEVTEEVVKLQEEGELIIHPRMKLNRVDPYHNHLSGSFTSGLLMLSGTYSNSHCTNLSFDFLEMKSKQWLYLQPQAEVRYEPFLSLQSSHLREL